MQNESIRHDYEPVESRVGLGNNIPHLAINVECNWESEREKHRCPIGNPHEQVFSTIINTQPCVVPRQDLFIVLAVVFVNDQSSEEEEQDYCLKDAANHILLQITKHIEDLASEPTIGNSLTTPLETYIDHAKFVSLAKQRDHRNQIETQEEIVPDGANGLSHSITKHS